MNTHSGGCFSEIFNNYVISFLYNVWFPLTVCTRFLGTQKLRKIRKFSDAVSFALTTGGGDCESWLYLDAKRSQHG